MHNSLDFTKKCTTLAFLEKSDVDVDKSCMSRATQLAPYTRHHCHGTLLTPVSSFYRLFDGPPSL